MSEAGKTGKRENPFALSKGISLDEDNIVIDEVLGSGGFGVTYRAFDKKSYGWFALKEYLPSSMVFGREGKEVSVYQEKKELFDKCMRGMLREARLLSSFNHENIVQVLFDMEENGTAYYGMELLKGQDLRVYLRGRSMMDAMEAYETLLPILHALEYLHERKVLHRDISPDNIFLRTQEEGFSPVLIDFGAAYSAQRDFTQTFPMVKKNGYSHLEQVWNGTWQGTWSDVYALSATFYYAMTKRTPVPASERGKEESDKLVRPRELNPEILPGVEEVLLKGLTLLPKKRIPTVRIFRQELEEALRFPNYPVSEGSSLEAGRGEKKPFGEENADKGFFDVSSSNMDSLESLSSKNSVPLSQGVGTAFATSEPNGKSFSEKAFQNLRHFLERISSRNAQDSEAEEAFASEEPSRPIKSHEASSSMNPSEPKKTTAAAYLRCISGSKEGELFSLDQRQTFGRGTDMSIRFPEEDHIVSRHHCMVRQVKDGYYVFDMNSRNGTFVNGVRLESGGRSARLRDGDVIKVGDDRFAFHDGEIATGL